MTLSRLDIVGIGVLFVALTSGASAKEKAGLFAPLEKGQKVSLKETPKGFEIAVVPGVELGFTITELGQDYIVLEDAADTTETRIPIFAIRFIKIIRLPKK